MMVVKDINVNPRSQRSHDTTVKNLDTKNGRKKAGPKEPGLGIGHVRPTQSPSKRDY
jgi:hypothetical protein